MKEFREYKMKVPPFSWWAAVTRETEVTLVLHKGNGCWVKDCQHDYLPCPTHGWLTLTAYPPVEEIS